MKLVIVESPFKGDRERNKRYLERCLLDCLRRGESPYASHKMLTVCLDDDDPEERELGIVAGMAWKRKADLTVFYVDLGWSKGMQIGLDCCRSSGFSYEVRMLPKDDIFWSEEKYAFCGACSCPRFHTYLPLVFKGERAELRLECENCKSTSVFIVSGFKADSKPTVTREKE